MDRFSFLNHDNFFDKYVFNPLSDYLIIFFRYLYFTPNQITYLSSIFNIISFLLFLKNYIYISSLFYFSGYLLDCTDGRYARKFNMTSNYGMMLDQVTDIVTNIPFLIVILYKNLIKMNFIGILLLISMSNLLSLSFSLDEAYDCQVKNNHDDFYTHKRLQILDSNDDSHIILYEIFKLLNEHLYIKYRNFMLKQQKIYGFNNSLRINILKESCIFYKQFGTGNYCMFIIFMILN